MEEIEHYQRLSGFVPKHAWDATIPILIRCGTQLTQHGTGTLFAVGADCFVITAGHVLRSAKEAGTGLYAATSRKDFLQLGGTWTVSDDEKSDGVFDVAVFQLANESQRRFQSSNFLRLSDVSFDFNIEYAVYTVFGFPSIWTHKKESDKSTLVAKAFQYTTYTYESSTSSLENFDPRHHLALGVSLDESRDENANFVDFSYSGGVSARFPADLGGISGGSVWHIGDRRYPLDNWPISPW